MVTLRPAGPGDLDAMAALAGEARGFLAANGVDQWQDGYPTREDLARDVARGASVVLEAEGVVRGMMYVSFDGDPDYNGIYDGSWAHAGPYAVIHRVAVSHALRGAGWGSALLRHGETMARRAGLAAIRMDTHRDNRAMRRLLEKNGYLPRGRVDLTGGTGPRPRVAYEKLLSPLTGEAAGGSAP